MLSRLAENLSRLTEAAAPVGTVHKWSSGLVRKTSAKTWEPVHGPGEKGAPSSDAPAKPAHDKPPAEDSKPAAHPHALPKPLPGPGKGPWKETAEGLPADTRELHYQNGRPKPERQKLHDEIIKKRLAPPPPGPSKRPVAVLMMGLTASGKSSIVQGVVGDGSAFVNVDPDAIKDDLPEFHEALSQRARNAAFLVHKESADVAARLKKEAVKSRRNVVIDGTGRDGAAYEETLKHLKKGNYEVHLMMAHCDTETAVDRAKERAEKTGRWVPPEVIRKMPREVHANFQRIAKLVDNVSLFDTNGFPPKQVWSKANGVETTHDADLYKAFRAKTSKGPFEAHHLRFLALSEEDEGDSTGPKPAAIPADEVVQRALRGLRKPDDRAKKYGEGQGIKEPEADDAVMGS